ncbi:hypothetical protein JTB14_020912 [Gonioctena quinquepunctata]|nr:hypothetical protein JTB14_020912 [Gonioctena quinquepunctata]
MKEYLDRRAQIFEEAAKEGQKSTMDEKLKKERKEAKQTPSLAVVLAHMETGQEKPNMIENLEKRVEASKEAANKKRQKWKRRGGQPNEPQVRFPHPPIWKQIITKMSIFPIFQASKAMKN